MSNSLDSLKHLLEWFIAQLDERRSIYQRNWPVSETHGYSMPLQLSEEILQPELSLRLPIHSIDPWKEEEARCWLFADSNHLPIQNMNDEFTPHKKDCWTLLPETGVYLVLAKEAYNRWMEMDLNIQEFQKHTPFTIPGDESLRDCLLRLWEKVNRVPDRKGNWLRFLRSFLGFLRENFIPKNEQAFLDALFPQEFGLIRKLVDLDFKGEKPMKNSIFRKTRFCAHRIDIVTAAAVLKGLAAAVLTGRSNAQHTAAETLALVWICLFHARTPQPSRVNWLSEIKQSQLINHQGRAFLIRPTSWGHVPTEISSFLAAYLSKLPNANALNPADAPLLTKHLNCLQRTLKNIIGKTKEAKKMGQITFQTFMNAPHPFIGRRCRHIRKRGRKRKLKNPPR